MPRYIDADELIKNLGIEGATKYGNKTAEQQSMSYSTYMAYEIMDSIMECICFVGNEVDIKEECKAKTKPAKHDGWLTWEEQFPGRKLTKKNNLGVFCSECHDHADNMTDYCPNCGAKMGE